MGVRLPVSGVDPGRLLAVVVDEVDFSIVIASQLPSLWQRYLAVAFGHNADASGGLPSGARSSGRSNGDLNPSRKKDARTFTARKNDATTRTSTRRTDTDALALAKRTSYWRISLLSRDTESFIVARPAPFCDVIGMRPIIITRRPHLVRF